jgi:dynein light intermediate chain 1
VWQAEGDPERLDLLKFGLNEENVDHAAVLICLDYSAPWTLQQQLTQWLGVVKQHIDSLNLPEERLELAKKRGKNRVQYDFSSVSSDWHLLCKHFVLYD